MRRRRIAWNLAATVYDKLLIAIVQLAMMPLLVGQWGVSLYGCWIVLAAAPTLLALADLGFGGAAYVRMTALVARGDEKGAAVVWHTACQVTALALCAIAALALAAIWTVPSAWLPTDPALPLDDARRVLTLLAVYVFAMLAGQLFSIALSSVGRFALAASANTHTMLVENLLLAGAALAGWGLVGGAAALLTGRLAGSIAKGLLLRWRARWLRPGFSLASAAERRMLARSAAGMLAVPVAQATALQGGVIALGIAAGTAAAPAFVAARTLSRLGLQGTQLLTHALMPEFGAAHARADTRGQAAMLLAVAALACAVALPFGLVIALTGDRLLALWVGSAITAPPWLMPAIALTVVLGGLWQPLSTLMVAIDRQGAFAWTYLLGGLAAVAGTLALAPTLGATGAALSMAALDGCMAAIVARFAWQHWLRGLPLRTVVVEARGRVRARLSSRR